MSDETVLLKVLRHDPSTDRAPEYQSYQVPWKEGLLLLGALKYVRENIDETLAFRDYCCGCSWCTSCLMMVNGKSTRTCSRVLNPGESVVVEPLKGFPVIRDLAVVFGSKGTTSEDVTKEDVTKMEGTVIRKE